MQLRYLSSIPTILDGWRTDPLCDSLGNLKVAIGAAASATSGAANATSRIVSSAASTNLTLAKGSAGTMFGTMAYNASAGNRFLRFYNSIAATVGSTTPVFTFLIPAGGYFVKDFPGGFAFSTGISYSLTAGSTADADTTVLASGDILGLNVSYV